VTELREEYEPCCGPGTVIVRRGLSNEWWTFAGLAANQTVVQYLQPFLGSPVRADNFWITLPGEVAVEELYRILQSLRGVSAPPEWNLLEAAADLLKFGDLLPNHLLRDLVLSRIADVPLARQILDSSVRFTGCD